MWVLKSEWELSLESENNNKYPQLSVASCRIGLPSNICQRTAQAAGDMLVVNVREPGNVWGFLCKKISD